MGTGRMEPKGLGHTAEELSTGLDDLVSIQQATLNCRRPDWGWMDGVAEV